jgi:hypothetical protein
MERWKLIKFISVFQLEVGYLKNKSKPVKVDKEREVDFTEMVQRRIDNPNRIRDVKRGMKEIERKEK